MTDQIKLDVPKFSIEDEPLTYNFAYVVSNLGVSWIAGLQLGMICLPGDVALNSAAVVTVEDKVYFDEEGDAVGDGDEPRTVFSFMNGHTLALDAEQMASLEAWIRRAQAEVMAASQQRSIGNRDPVMIDGRTKQMMDAIKQKAGLK